MSEKKITQLFKFTEECIKINRVYSQSCRGLMMSLLWPTNVVNMSWVGPLVWVLHWRQRLHSLSCSISHTHLEEWEIFHKFPRLFPLLFLLHHLRPDWINTSCVWRSSQSREKELQYFSLCLLIKTPVLNQSSWLKSAVLAVGTGPAAERLQNGRRRLVVEPLEGWPGVRLR